jgi:hypothetical protein
MLSGLTMPARIVRLTALSVFGLALTYAMGITTMGAMMVYCGLLHMYAASLTDCRSLLKKRLLLQFIGLPIAFAIQFTLSLVPGLPVKLRLCIGAAVSLPLLLTLNYRAKLGFSEVSLHVVVALITVTFDANRAYALYRLLLTTVGVAVGYLVFRYVWPLRNDRAYEEKRALLLEALADLADRCAREREKPGPALDSAKAIAGQAWEQLEIVCADVNIKRQYAAYRGKAERLQWEREVCAGFLAFYETWEKEGGDFSQEHLRQCAAAAGDYWERFQRLCAEDDGAPPEKPPGWDAASLGHVAGPADLALRFRLERLRMALCRGYTDFAALSSGRLYPPSIEKCPLPIEKGEEAPYENEELFV